MRHFKDLEEPFWLNFDRRVRAVAVRLWSAGFSMMEPGDDEDDDFDEPHVFLECAPEDLFAEAHRLQELVKSWRIPDYELVCSECGGETCGVEAVYDRVYREAYIVLWGIDDQMLAPDVGDRRAAGRPRSRELCSLALGRRHKPGSRAG